MGFAVNKIILGYEKFEVMTGQGWNLNGRLNSQPLKSPPADQGQFYDHIYRTLIHPTAFPDSYRESAPLFVLQETDSHVSLPVDLIPPHQKYFYPIVIKSMHYLTEYIESFNISDQVRSDVQSGRAHILFLYIHEGDLSQCGKRFDDLVTAMCLPKSQILFLHGSHNIEKFRDAPYTYVPLDVFHWWLSDYADLDSLVAYTGDQLFLMYNRQVRFHRLLMLAALIKRDLLHKGIVSCGVFRYHDIRSICRSQGLDLNDDQLKILHSMELQSPDNEISNNDINNRANFINSRHHERTLVSLVAETLSDDIFLSEKTYKPMVTGHPFLLLGAPGHLRHLKNLGYRTFHEYWNEDYDQEPHLISRIQKITDILSDLNRLDTPARQQMRQDMLPILQHNHNRFRESLDRSSSLHDQTPVRNFLETLMRGNHV